MRNQTEKKVEDELETGCQFSASKDLNKPMSKNTRNKEQLQQQPHILYLRPFVYRSMQQSNSYR